MNDNQTKSFGQIAVALAKSPIGIIALFIVLVYGFASLVTIFTGSLNTTEKQPMIWFLVIFPVLVLIAFTWLVYTGKIFAPGDYKNEDNFLKMRLSAVASLATASAKSETPISETDLQKIIDAVMQTMPANVEGVGWRKDILWVDDNPDGNIFVRKAFESFGLRITLALSTKEALEQLKLNKYGAIISDMGRKEGPREGYVLLESIRSQGNSTPFFIYAGSKAPEHIKETEERGGQGCTNNAQELFQLVTNAVINHS